MKTKIIHLSTIAGIAGLFLLMSLLSGCGGSQSTVRVTRRGGIAIDSSMVFTVGNILGDAAKDFRKELRKSLKQTANFTLLEGAPENVPDSVYLALARAQMEQHHVLLVITGIYTAEKSDESKEETDANNVKTKYREKNVTCTFSYHVTDVAKNKLLIARGLERKGSSKEPDNGTWLGNKLLGMIVGDPLEEGVRKQVVDAFAGEIPLHEEAAYVEFLRDSEMPELETGISYANLGQWDKAIELFKNVRDKYPSHKEIHKAYYDLGIAYKWTNKFPEAKESLEKAYLLKNQSAYYNEIQSLPIFESEYKMRQELEAQHQ